MGVWFGRENMLEKRLVAVPPQSFTADGSNLGVITVFNATLFVVKQQVLLNGTSLPTAELEVKRVLNLNQLVVGPRNSNIDETIDISAYTVAANATISAIQQKRPSIPLEEFWRAVYAEEPAVALRGLAVDQLGNPLNKDNPYPIKTGTFWDEADITRDGDDDITKVEFSKYGNLVETVDLEYNGEKSVIKVIKS